mgnify:CR=1 FL=1
MAVTDGAPLARLATLASEVDAAFGAIQARRSDRMRCAAGCSACCRARLSITRVEATFLRDGLASLPGARRSELSARTREVGREPCPALDDDGRCGVYAFRPLICRSYGVPLRHRRDVALVNPPVIDACDLNFVGILFDSIPIDASAMTHFHLDVYAPEGSNFKVKLVSFPPGGAGVETLDLVLDGTTTPVFVAGGWSALDIPLADFTTPDGFDWSAIGQLVLSTNDSRLVLVDNIHFHK